jgi:hypothetical protein
LKHRAWPKLAFVATCTVLAALNVAAQTPAPATLPGSEYSGMYSFLRDGEFVQVTIEDQGRVSGFVSRYGDLDSDRGAFLDHFFKQGKLDGNKLTFTTDTRSREVAFKSFPQDVNPNRAERK